MKLALSFALLLFTAVLAVCGQFATAIAVFCFGSVALARQTAHLCVTLSAPEVCMDVIDAFKKRVPALNKMGTDFTAKALKLNQTYTAHIVSVPATEDVTNAHYGNLTGQTGRSLLTDVPVVVNKHIACKIKLQHLYNIQDNKIKYEKAIGNMGYSMSKSLLDNIITGFTPDNFSQNSLFTVANSDADMLDDICSDMNLVGADNEGRVMLVNTPVAGILAADTRLTSADYAGQRVRGNGYRRWTDVNGFSEVVEYPDLANTTSGTALTAVTVANTGDLFTKADHGLITGQTVSAASFSAGFTSGTYNVIRVSSSTFQLASSYANAIAGTAVAASADGTGGVITATQTLTGFGFEARAIAILAGIPEDFDVAVPGFTVNKVMNVEYITDPESGLTMAAITWQEAGTGDVYLVFTMVYGKGLGRQSGGAAVGALTDYAGHRLVSA